jgi:hypothetical protein
MKKWCRLVIGIAVLCMILGIPLTVQSQAIKRCFPETRFCIQGVIKEYWEGNGGLPIFGYPISNETVQKIGDWQGPTQWFERDRLEDHGNTVLAGRLGVQKYEQYYHHTWTPLADGFWNERGGIPALM